MGFEISEILINQEKEPLGTDIACPEFSWKFQSEENCMKQKKYRITVGSAKGIKDYWDTEILESDKSICVEYSGKKLIAETKYYVTLEAWNQKGESAKAEASFETGLMNSSIKAWDGAQWIGAPEYYVSSDTISVFSIESTIAVEKGSTKAGIIFGANDERLVNKDRNECLLAGRNYICYALNVSQIPAVMEIYRVGYHEDDLADKPFAYFTVVSKETNEPVITEENKHIPHEIKIKVMGNGAYAYVDGILVDAIKRKTFLGEKVAPRQLNPLGHNDVTTFPRLCSVGYYVEKGSRAFFNGLTIRNIREPKAVILELDKKNGKSIYAEKEDAFEIINPSKHSLPMLRCDFKTDKLIKRARLYATARGIYTVMINGKKISDNYFAPGSSQYDKHLMYQTYDITETIKKGENGIGFTLSSGWWSDMSTYALYNYNYWGDKPSILAKIVITYEDGEKKIINTNCNEWQYYGEGPFIYAGFFNGEQFDANRKWIYDEYSLPGFKIEGLKSPELIQTVAIKGQKSTSEFLPGWPDVNFTEPQIIGSFNAPVVEMKIFTAKEMVQPSKGVYIYDLGQEIAGIPKIYFHEKKGVKVRIRYGEMLYPYLSEYGQLSGKLLQANLREASNTDIYITKGDEEEVFKPEFTFHGFRYIEITGVEKAPKLTDVKGILLSSIQEITGEFKCDEPLINRFVSNVKYSMLSNYISIPTDCPQRNERMGWTGDTHVFTRTATYQSNVKNFLLRNMQAMKDLQDEDGYFPDIAPVGGGFGGITYESALIIMTWELYQQYGDKKVIEHNYNAMKKWMSAMENVGMPGETYRDFLGDWLAIKETDKNLVCNAFYGRDAHYMKEFAKVLNLHEDVEKFKQVEYKTKEYWNKTFINDKTCISICLDGSVCDTQGSYAIGLDCGMFEGDSKKLAVENLVRKTKEAGYTIQTGFFGTGALNRILTREGYHGVAYRLITQTAYPSWLYPVTQGATTIWERWDSFIEQKGFGGNNAMNSFNHYSLGSVLSWLYESILGIYRDENNPGYKHFTLKPEIYGFSYANGGINTPYGRIESSWTKVGNAIDYQCKIPENTSAVLILNGERFELQSGMYKFHKII